jgi:hypothetical protein
MSLSEAHLVYNATSHAVIDPSPNMSYLFAPVLPLEIVNHTLPFHRTETATRPVVWKEDRATPPVSDWSLEFALNGGDDKEGDSGGGGSGGGALGKCG